MEQLQSLIDEAQTLRIENRHAGRRIESAACAIRERALLDAWRAIFGRTFPDAGGVSRLVLPVCENISNSEAIALEIALTAAIGRELSHMIEDVAPRR
jgi:hypothetical protein